MFSEYKNILNGSYDMYAFTTDQKKSLEFFKNRYKGCTDIEIFDIAFEDYFLIFEIFCIKNRIGNPKLFEKRKSLKRFFIDSIFNRGKIQNLYKMYPNSLRVFFNQYDTIFTTNYV